MTRSTVKGIFAGYAPTKAGRPIRLDFDVRVRPSDPNTDTPAPKPSRPFPGAALVLVNCGATAEAVKLALLKTCIELETFGLRAVGETDEPIVKGDNLKTRRNREPIRRSIKRPASRRSTPKQ